MTVNVLQHHSAHLVEVLRLNVKHVSLYQAVVSAFQLKHLVVHLRLLRYQKLALEIAVNFLDKLISLIQHAPVDVVGVVSIVVCFVA